MTSLKEQAEAYYNEARQRNFYGDMVLDYLNSAISLDPDDFKYHMGRGIARMSKDAASAIKDFEKALSLNPGHAEAYFMRGRMKLVFNQHGSAFEDFTKAIELSPFDNRYFESRAETRYVLKDYEGAISDYSQTILLVGKSNKTHDGIYTHINRGKARLAINDYRGAFEDFDKSIEIQKTSTAFCERSNAKIDTGDLRGAYEDFVTAMSLDDNENVTIQFYEKGFSKISAAELIKAVLYCYTEIGQWDKDSANQLAIEIVYAKKANNYRKVAKEKLEIQDYLGALDLLKQALLFMPEKYIWYNEIREDLEKTRSLLQLPTS